LWAASMGTDSGYCIGSSCITAWSQASPGDPVTLSAVRTYTSSGTWTKPSDLSYVVVEVWGGGGSGSQASWFPTGSGGGGGGYSSEFIPAGSLPSSVSVSVGAGGVAPPYPPQTIYSGNPGGASSFGSFLSASGGAGGTLNGAYAYAVGGSGSGGDLNMQGSVGFGFYAGPAATTWEDTLIRSSFGGGAPRGGGDAYHGETGHFPGGGGGGAGSNSGNAGAGASGAVVIYEYTQ
jgi:hypothetical protein